MKFSIVITTYNRLELLTRAIETSLSQTISCEVVVVDDCSTDETQDYVSQLCKDVNSKQLPQLIYHRNFQNLGHSQSVNAGVKRATGEWIKLLDDDDYLALNCLEEMGKVIDLHPKSVICSVQAAQVDVNEVELTRTRRVGPGKAFFIPQEDIHYGMLLEQIPFGTPVQVAFRRDAFLKTSGWDSTLDANFDDIDSWIQIAQFGDALFINRCLAYRTIWPGAYNQKFSLQTRLKTNLLIKQKIYQLVHSKYQHKVPSLGDINHYLQLHWSLASLKQGQLFSAGMIAFPSIFYPSAWKLLLEKAIERNQSYATEIKHYNRLDSSSALNFMYQNALTLLHKYLKVRWGINALQKKKLLKGIKILIIALFHMRSWKLLFIAVFPQLYQRNLILRRKLERNILLMEKIYSDLQTHNPDIIPQLKEVQNYIKLRPFLLAFQERNIISTLKFSVRAILSPAAWKILSKIARLRPQKQSSHAIRKLVLIKS